MILSWGFVNCSNMLPLCLQSSWPLSCYDYGAFMKSGIQSSTPLVGYTTDQILRDSFTAYETNSNIGTYN